MSDVFFLDLFVEDRAHEEFLRPLAKRLAREESIKIEVHVRNARGGHARAIQEFELYQKLLERGAVTPGPDLLVVCIDGNCSTFAEKRREIQQKVLPSLTTPVVAACPDPHIERWYLADVEAFRRTVGHRPVLGKKKCTKGHYKEMLIKAIRKAGHLPTLGGIEFARELAESIDWYRAGKADRSFKVFVDDLRSALGGLSTHGARKAGSAPGLPARRGRP